MTIRIITGRLKGRTIVTSTEADYRPTTGQAKETLFSILSSGQFVDEEGVSIVEQAQVLDVCAGTGALGFEALSRGASSVIFIDSSREHLRFIHQNATKFVVEQEVSFWYGDATNLAPAPQAHNLVFIDPPYNQNITHKIMASLAQQGWLAENALIITELPSRHKLEEAASYEKIYHRSNGRTSWHFWRYLVNNNASRPSTMSSANKEKLLDTAAG